MLNSDFQVLVSLILFSAVCVNFFCHNWITDSPYYCLFNDLKLWRLQKKTYDLFLKLWLLHHLHWLQFGCLAIGSHIQWLQCLADTWSWFETFPAGFQHVVNWRSQICLTAGVISLTSSKNGHIVRSGHMMTFNDCIA